MQFFGMNQAGALRDLLFLLPRLQVRPADLFGLKRQELQAVGTLLLPAGRFFER